MTELRTPARLFPGLFQAVAEAGLFADGKLFADAVPRRDPAAIMADYSARAPMVAAALLAFVAANFDLPPPVAAPLPADGIPLRAHIAAAWDALTRAPVAARGSALAIDHRHVVPGGRFRELYYWDSYFTLLGLTRDRPELAQSMVSLFAELIERFGHVPNGARTYYVGRSQPPVFALMLDLAPAPEPAEAARRLDAALAEHRFWTAEPRAVRLPDGALLARYGAGGEGPREESWREDMATAAAGDRPHGEIWRDLRAAAESGWDFSSRWLIDDLPLASIRTTAIVPIDLNALLYAGERILARQCRRAGRSGEADALDERATVRRGALDRFCWDALQGCYFDFCLDTGRHTAKLTAASLFPLFAGAASPEQADRVAALTERLLLAPGGLRTTLVRSGEQWDAPNGWAPLQWAAIAGLRRYGHRELADRIAAAWLATVERHFARTGQILEKYDVETGLGGSGGEYDVQAGFGWTNGVCAALLDERVPSRT